MRAAVFGGPQRGADLPACLRGYRRVVARGRRYPILVRQPTAVTDGLLIARMGGRAWRRALAYEGVEYRLARVRVWSGGRLRLARVFLSATLGATGRPWSAI